LFQGINYLPRSVQFVIDAGRATTSERLSWLALYAAAVLCFPVISRSFDSLAAGRALEAVANAMTPCALNFSAFLITSTL
jgi:hypothetical protein